MSAPKTPSFIEKLREKQASQQQLVDAIDELHNEKKRVQILRLKYLAVFLGLIAASWFSFQALSPVLSSLWAETTSGLTQYVGGLDIKGSVQSLFAKTKGGKAQPPAAAPTAPAPANGPKELPPSQASMAAVANGQGNAQPGNPPAAQAPNQPAGQPAAQATAQPGAQQTTAQPGAQQTTAQPGAQKNTTKSDPQSDEDEITPGIAMVEALPGVTQENPFSQADPRQKTVAEETWVRPVPAAETTYSRTHFREPTPAAIQRASAVQVSGAAPQPARTAYRDLSSKPQALEGFGAIDKNGK